MKTERQFASENLVAHHNFNTSTTKIVCRTHYLTLKRWWNFLEFVEGFKSYMVSVVIRKAWSSADTDKILNKMNDIERTIELYESYGIK